MLVFSLDFIGISFAVQAFICYFLYSMKKKLCERIGKIEKQRAENA